MTFNFKQLFALTVLVYILAAIFSKGYHHFDEHFQIIEMANYKLGNIPATEMPWELQYKMRPTLQPLIAYFSIKAFGLIGVTNPFLVATFLRILSAALALFVYFQLFKLFKGHFQDRKMMYKLFAISSFLLWYLVYNGVRFSSENWSGLLFAMAFVCYSKRPHNTFLHFWVGVLFGLAFFLRFQTAFMTIGMMLWMLFINKERFLNLSIQILGIIFSISLGILSDYWFYEEFTISFLNYLEQGLSQEKLHTFVSRPISFYFTRFFSQGIPPISLLTMISIIGFLFIRKKSPITWMLIPFLIVHFFVDHKELRFFFTIIPFIPIIIFSFLNYFQKRKQLIDKKWIKYTLIFTIYLNLLFVLVATFRPADPYISFYEEMYDLSEKKSTLFYIKNNPYHRITNIFYYKPKNLEIMEYTKKLNLNGRESYVVLKGKTKLPDEIGHAKMIYSSFPSWLYTLNFNNWIEKSGSIRLYKLN